jgi:hypothetical protein
MPGAALWKHSLAPHMAFWLAWALPVLLVHAVALTTQATILTESSRHLSPLLPQTRACDLALSLQQQPCKFASAAVAGHATAHACRPSATSTYWHYGRHHPICTHLMCTTGHLDASVRAGPCTVRILVLICESSAQAASQLPVSPDAAASRPLCSCSAHAQPMRHT